MKETWRKQMQQKMADYEQSAPELDWDVVERRVAAAGSKARVVPMWLQRVAAAVAIVAIAVAGYEIFDKHQDTDTLTATETTTPERHLAIAATKDMAEAEKPAGQLTAVTLRHPTTTKSAAGTEPAEVSAAPEPASPAEAVYEVPDSDVSPKEPTARPKEFFPQESATTSGLQSGHKGKTEPRLTAKVYITNSLASGGSIDLMSGAYDSDPVSYNDANPSAGNTPPNICVSLDGEHDKSHIDPNDEQDKGHIDPNGEQDNGKSTPPEEVPPSESVSHRQPVRFGVALRYRLDDRWSVESGLTCTVLSSDITLRSKGQTVKTEQRLTYIGIPLKLNCQLWNRRALSVYSSAGGMIEQMVSGRRTTLGQQSHVSQSMPQFSVNGAIGLEYRFTRQLGLYLEPALEYHFAGSSDLPTIYRDEPLSLSLGLGLRITVR